jgi:hypothetical protein
MLIQNWFRAGTLGRATQNSADLFIRDLASRLANRAQTDNGRLKTYLQPVKQAFNFEIDYAMC